MNDDTNQDEAGERGRSWLVRGAVAGALVIFVLACSVIWYRFITTPETSSSIVLIGNSSLEGYTARAHRVSSNPELARIRWEAQFNASDRYVVRFFVPSGTYRVSVHDPQGLQIISDVNFLPPTSRMTLDVSGHKSEKRRPATMR